MFDVSITRTRLRASRYGAASDETCPSVPVATLNDGQLDAALNDARADGVAGESGGVVEVEFLHEMLAVLLGEGMTEERYFPLGLSVAPRAASGRRFDYNQARHARRQFQEQSALRRHPANHGQAPKTEAQKANSQKAAGSGTAVGTVMTL